MSASNVVAARDRDQVHGARGPASGEPVTGVLRTPAPSARAKPASAPVRLPRLSSPPLAYTQTVFAEPATRWSVDLQVHAGETLAVVGASS